MTPPERAKLTDRMELLSFRYCGRQLILQPSDGDALLDPNNPKLLDDFNTELRSKRTCRLMVLMRTADDISPAIMFGAFYLFPDGSFCVSKMGGSKLSCENFYGSETPMNYALLLVEALVLGAISYWKDPEKVPYEQIFEGIQRPSLGFLPSKSS